MTIDREFSHVALGVARGEGDVAARFLRLLGLHVTDNGPSLVGDPWYTAVIDVEAHDGDMGHLGFFVIPASDAQVDLERVVADLPELKEFLAEKERKPDSSAHVALRFRALEHLDRAVAALDDDPEVAARVNVLRFRPLDAAPGVDDRLDASPAFAGATRVRYLRDGVQAFVQTDLVSAGLLALGQSFELNCTIRSE